VTKSVKHPPSAEEFQMAITTLDDLFVHTLRDILYAERQILKALPKMARKASSAKLRKAFETHHSETEDQIQRLEKVFDEVKQSARGSKCEAIIGLIEEAEDQMDEISDPEVLDAAMLATAQAVEHYEISRYGTLLAYAERLGYSKQLKKLLTDTLNEEKQTDAKLSKLAESKINDKAAA
jgi:ferritin-like metal-binding protein YciE